VGGEMMNQQDGLAKVPYSMKQVIEEIRDVCEKCLADYERINKPLSDKDIENSQWWLAKRQLRLVRLLEHYNKLLKELE
jgi:hypothetical protein